MKCGERGGNMTLLGVRIRLSFTLTSSNTSGSFTALENRPTVPLVSSDKERNKTEDVGHHVIIIIRIDPIKEKRIY